MCREIEKLAVFLNLEKRLIRMDVIEVYKIMNSAEMLFRHSHLLFPMVIGQGDIH